MGYISATPDTHTHTQPRAMLAFHVCHQCREGFSHFVDVVLGEGGVVKLGAMPKIEEELFPFYQKRRRCQEGTANLKLFANLKTQEHTNNTTKSWQFRFVLKAHGASPYALLLFK